MNREGVIRPLEKPELRPDPAWQVYHPLLGLLSPGNWSSPWVETGPRYQGPEDAALSSREKLGRVWGVA